MEAEQDPIKLNPAGVDEPLFRFVLWVGLLLCSLVGTCWEEAILCKTRAWGPH